MSILGFLFKSRKEMAKPNTKHVRIGKYKITAHAQNRIVENKRKLKKKDMVVNLFGRSSKNSKTYVYKDGTIQYDRVNSVNRTITHITKNGHCVKTIQKFHNSRKGEKEAYRYFK